MKIGRIICELERIYGIKRGRPELNATNGLNKSQDKIADMLGSSNPKGTNIGDTPLVGDVSQTDIADVKRGNNQSTSPLDNSKTQTDIAQELIIYFYTKIKSKIHSIISSVITLPIPQLFDLL